LAHFGEKLATKRSKCCDFCKDPKKVKSASENYVYRPPQKEDEYSVEDAAFGFEFDKGNRCDVFDLKRTRSQEQPEEAPALKRGSVKSRIWDKLDKIGK
jgi:hypothetical protein